MRIKGEYRNRVYQWDKNRRLMVDEYPEGTQIHFAHEGDASPIAPVVKTQTEDDEKDAREAQEAKKSLGREET